MKQKIIFFSVWILILAIGPYTLIKNSLIGPIFHNNVLLFNFLQRLAGLLAFSLIFVQIMLGSFMNKWIEKFGGWIFNFHVIEGIFVYLFILSHPFFFVLINYKLKGIFDPFYVFTDLCVLCKNKLELYYTFGRVAFWLITIAALAAGFRTQPWLIRNWRKFHILSYFAFFFVALHSWVLGSDIASKPFIWFYWTAIILVIFSLLHKMAGLLPKFTPKKI